MVNGQRGNLEIVGWGSRLSKLNLDRMQLFNFTSVTISGIRFTLPKPPTLCELSIIKSDNCTIFDTEFLRSSFLARDTKQVLIDRSRFHTDKKKEKYKGNGRKAVQIWNGSLMIKSTTIEGYYTLDTGAAIFLSQSNMVMNNCTLVRNTADRSGGGIYFEPIFEDFLHLRPQFYSLYIFNSTITNNSARLQGGGIFSAARLTIYNSTVLRNHALDGGGIYLDPTNYFSKMSQEPGSIIKDCNISRNSANSKGGSVYVYAKNIQIENTNFFDNPAGSTLKLLSGEAIVDNCTFSNTTSFTSGAAIFSESFLTVSNSTFTSFTLIENGNLVWSTNTSLISHNNFYSVNSLDYLRLSSKKEKIRFSENNLWCSLEKIVVNRTVSNPKRTEIGCAECGRNQYTLGSGRIVGGVIMNPTCKSFPEGMFLEDGTGELKIRGEYWCGVDTTGQEKEYGCHICPLGFCGEISRNMSQMCAENRDGTLCGSCVANHTQSLFGSSCIPSSACSWMWILPYIGLSIFYIGLYLSSTFDGKTSWKSAIFVLQTFSLLSPLNPWNVFSFFFFGGRKEGSHFGACLDGNMSPEETVLVSVYASLLVPGLALLGLIISGIFYCHKKRSNGDVVMGDYELIEEANPLEEKRLGLRNPSLWGRVILQSFLLVYGSLLQSCLNLLLCVTIFGQKVLYLDGKTTCNTGTERIFLFIFVALLLPFPLLLLSCWYWSKRNPLTNIQKNILIILESSYKDGCKGWESISYTRRLILITIFIFTRGTERVFFLLISAISFLILQVTFQPMLTKDGNKLETKCLISLVAISSLEAIRLGSLWSPLVIDLSQAIFLGFALMMCFYSLLKPIITRWCCRPFRKKSKEYIN